jgi:hypothetical protein
MVLGSLLTIAVEIALVAKGVGAVGDFFNQASSSASSNPSPAASGGGAGPDDLFEETTPKSFNGVPNHELDIVCHSTLILTSRQQKACDQRDAYVRSHGHPAPR